MKTKTIRCVSGWYAVMVWDESRHDWSLWWSGSKVLADAEEEVKKILRSCTSPTPSRG